MSAFADHSFQGETLFGTFYPKGYVVAAFRDRQAATDALATLNLRGFGEARVWSGDEVLARHDEFMAQRSTLQRIGSAFGSDEKVALEDYLDAARDGHFLLTVHVPSEADVEQVRAVIVPGNARLMHYYGTIGMADLAEQGARPPQPFPPTDGVNEPSGPPPASPGEAQRDPAW